MINPYIIYPIICAFLGAIGSILQRKGLKAEKFSLRQLLKSKSWWAGYIIGLPIAYFSALGYNNLDVSILAPVGNLGIPILIIMSALILKEKISKHEAIGIALLFTSAVILGFA
ncbi:MAG: DMT family transporter [Candidatus Omnitrophica bacterium]|nr:DMT family transporter [Candidatus Omnitrophota bacterium]